MSAVIEHGAAGLPLIGGTGLERPLIWRQGRAVSAGAVLADSLALAAQLPPGRDAANLWDDRQAFLIGFCAVLLRGGACLLPPSRAPQAVAEVLAGHAGSYPLARQAGGPVAVAAGPDTGGTGCGPGAGAPQIPGSQRAAIGFTSGTTGRPCAHGKTWATFHAGTALNIAALRALPGLAGGGTVQVVATVPSQHMYGLEFSVLLPLLGDFAVSCRQPLLPADVAAALAEVPAPRLLVSTPFHLRALLDSGVRLPALAGVTSATAPLEPELAQRIEQAFGAPLLEFLGSTETCVIARRRPAQDAAWRAYRGISLRPQPDGTLVEAPHLPGPVLLQDLVELEPDGRFLLRGRQQDLVEVAGKRASLADINRRLLALDGVHDAAAVQLDDEGCGIARIAAAVVAPGRSASALLQELRAILDPVFLPRPLRRVAALPRNEAGKLPRETLLELLRAPARENPPPGLQSATAAE